MALRGINSTTLYEQCITTYVNNLNYNVSTLDRIHQLHDLPTNVLIDVYEQISYHDNLLNMLFEELSNLEIFERLLRFQPARQQLFLCLRSLMSTNRALAAQLKQQFVERYSLYGYNNTSLSTTTITTTTAKASPTSTSTTATGPATATSISTTGTEHIHNANTPNEMHINAYPNLDENKENQQLTINVVSNEKLCCNVEKKPLPLTDVDFDALEQADALAKEALHDITESEPSNYKIIDFGMRLGSFLSEAGWLYESVAILQCVAIRLRYMRKNDKFLQTIHLDCLQRLLHSEAALCNFKTAQHTFDMIQNELLPTVELYNIPKSLLANTYIQFSAMHFARSEYDESHRWSCKAMSYLDEKTPARIVVDVLRQASKSCVVKRDFLRANLLICEASNRAKKVFGVKHQKYADTLLDYGFFLLNVDSVYQSVVVYKDALDIKYNIFGNRNFHVAIAHEDLSYAYYVYEYSTGNFTCARNHVDKAVEIMKELVPNNHLMLASARRVKALLLEEIALDKMADGGGYESDLLTQSEELHKFALQLSLEVFGETNVQTAKHYGNLGRLYQTMNRFEEAECMHQKAIKIKTLLLGPYDYEVGLSIGHLASLYNYQMKKYKEAEELYFRSIDISIRLFGRGYSGLEYDYLGLCHVYETLREFEKYLKYATILENWQLLRAQNNGQNKILYPSVDEQQSLEDLKQKFFNMTTTNQRTAVINNTE